MDNATCVASGCLQPPAKSRRGMCAKHYRDSWKQKHSCSVEGCERTYFGNGFCGLHYHRDREGIDLSAPVLGSGKAAGCGVDGCTEPYHANGYCAVHAQRLNRTGDPLGVRREVRDSCTVDGCDDPHMGLGYCRLHLKRHHRYGDAELQAFCRVCGTEYDRDASRSYFYCDACHDGVAAACRQRRLDRLAANNAAMTDADWLLSGDYVSIIRHDPCSYCGAPCAAIDHIHPVAAGGSDCWENLAPICKRCNSRKRTTPVLRFMLVTLAA